MKRRPDWFITIAYTLLALVLFLWATGCTRLKIDGIGSYTRIGTDFNGELTQTSDTLTLRIGSHLNPQFVSVPATALGAAIGAATR